MRYAIIDGIEVPDDLVTWCLCEENKAQIKEDRIHDFVDDILLPYAKQFPAAGLDLHVTSNHVHIGSNGLTPHNHLPHALTSIFYLVDAEGELVISPTEEPERVKPVTGRLVIIQAHIFHAVTKSPDREMRLSLVTNYGYP
jgi:hypothetical protein